MIEHEYFKMPFYQIGNINWNNPQAIDFVAADTETHLFYNEELLTEERAEELLRENGQSWAKSNIEVRAWAYMLANADIFCCFQCIEDFILALALLRVKTVVWYNAKFDFAIFDYYFLTHNWQLSDDILKGMQYYGKLPDKTYQSLHGQQGQRYKLTIWKEYINKNNDKRTHKVEMIDLFNVLQGGLKRNLECWEVTDKDGNPIRKLEMDYVNDSIDECIDYLINDTVGLYYLTVKFSDEFEKITGLSYLKGDYMTAGGCAKKVMLQEMYNLPYKQALKAFQAEYPMTPEFDLELRSKHLYRGGKTLVNNDYVGKVVHNLYKFDENSMYPDKMANYPMPHGKPKCVSEPIEGNINIYHITSMNGWVKENMIGVWQSLTYSFYCDTIEENDDFYIFEEELKELDNYYHLVIDYDFVYSYEPVKSEGLERFITKFYDIKSKSKGTVKQVAKIILNSSYGKLAEKTVREVGKYELSSEGYVHYVKVGEQGDNKSILSVVLGSYITALARIDLMRSIRQVSKGNPKKNFVYCDTDSIHSFTRNIETDDKILGKFKNESPDGGVFRDCIYLAPKSYIMQHYLYDIQPNSDTLVVHCKGVSTKEVRKLIEGKPFKEMLKYFKPNYPIRCLTGLNAIGGKALIYKSKFILRKEKNDMVFDTSGNEGVFYER